MSLNTGTTIAKLGIKQFLSGEKADLLEKLVAEQSEYFSKELGELKGSLMKAGQALSMYGEHFLPKEANEFLKKLQFQSPPLAWESMLPIIKQALGEKIHLLEIDQNPLASASIGQVHRAKIKSTGEQIVLKVQYPDVDKSIDSDLKALKVILKVLGFLPKELDTAPIFAEVKKMLEQEVDYDQERQFTELYYAKNQQLEESKIIIPKIYPEFSSRKLIASEYLSGYFADEVAVQELSQERRNNLAAIFLNHFFTEFLTWGLVQTDPHQGNFKIHIGEKLEDDKIIMIDFGACRNFDEKFRRTYAQFLKGSLIEDRKLFEASSIQLGFLLPGDPQELKDLFFQFCITTMEPYKTEKPYDWGSTTLPNRLKQIGFQIVGQFPLRTPPSEILFLDRKTGGVFIFLKILKAHLASREIIEKFLGNEGHLK